MCFISLMILKSLISHTGNSPCGISSWNRSHISRAKVEQYLSISKVFRFDFITEVIISELSSDGKRKIKEITRKVPNSGPPNELKSTNRNIYFNMSVSWDGRSYPAGWLWRWISSYPLIRYDKSSFEGASALIRCLHNVVNSFLYFGKRKFC